MYVEDIIDRLAPEISNQIVAIAKWALSEEDLRIEVEKQLDPFLKLTGLKDKLKGHHEFTIGKGRADSVYSLVIIEYKKPGRLTNSNASQGNQEVIEQLKERFIALEKQENRPRERMFGVGTDGFRFIFIRYRAKSWEISEPIDVTEKTVKMFLRRLSSLGVAGKALLPEYLVGDFGPESSLAVQCVQSFYEKLQSPTSKRAAKLFEQWQVMFREVCGYDLKTPREHLVKLAEKYQIKGDLSPSSLLFAIHSYYATFMKLLATEILTFYHKMPSYLGRLSTLTGPLLRTEFVKLEKEGGIFRQMNIVNYLEGDLFTWYLDEIDDVIERNLHQVVETLSQYDPNTLTVEPDESRDLLKGLYQYMIDRSVRHDLGEYYTPDWLAELLLDEVGYEGNPEKRFLDPACGSGTFLVLAINRIRMYSEEKMIPQEQTLEYILKNVVGFDLNPLAVMAARTNYIIALGDLVRYRKKDLEIPVYLCDSVLAPEAFTTLYAKSRKVRTSVGDFLIPANMEDSERISILTSTIEHCASNDYSASEFLELVKSNLKLLKEDFESSKELLSDIYQKIAKLEKDGIDGIWSRIIKNGFAPVYVGEFDFVIGNPPWVRWGFLSDGYRKATLDLWKNYGLFSLKGYAARLGGGEKDFSMLFTYACCDHYLKKHGSLGFLITQTVFKSKGAGEGFRRFRLGDRDYLKVYKAHDFVDLKPFEDATNLTAAVFLKKGEKTTYPIPYILWKKKEGQVVSPEMSLKAIRAKTQRLELSARPIGKETSSWQTGSKKIIGILKRAKGKAAYRAFIGARAEPYGIYWVRILSKEAGNNLLVENLHDIGKTEIPKIQRTIEPDFVFPFLRGKDIAKWKTTPRVFALIVQDPNRKMGYEEKWMKLKKPKTYAYLKLFQDKLARRANYLKYYDPRRAPFYSQYNIRVETFSQFKVVWKRMASQLEAAVVSSVRSSEIGTKKVIPSDTTSFVPLEKEIEAHYVCAMMNSSFVRKQIVSFSAAGRGFGSPSILEHVGIPEFNPHNSQHVKIAELSIKAHKFMSEMPEEKAKQEVSKIEKEIDILVGRIFGLEQGELEQIDM